MYINESDDVKCEIVEKGNITFLNVDFQGIPENVIINIVVSIVIVLTFLVIKKIVWTHKEKNDNMKQVGWISLFFRDVYYYLEKSDYRFDFSYTPMDKSMSYCQMLRYIFFQLEEKAILRRCGMDAGEYLLFLRICIEYNFINTLVMLAAVLPANYHGTLLSNPNTFMKTTMGNVDILSDSIWIHLVAEFFLMCIFFVEIRKFSKSLLHHYKTTTWSKRTILMKETGNRPITVERVEKFYRDTLPRVEIDDIKLVYKYKRLIQLHKKLKTAEEALNMCQYIYRTDNRQVYVLESCWFCRYYCKFPCRKKEVNGITYYNNEIHEVKKLIAIELNRLSSKILHYAFVTFRSNEMAYRARSIKKASHEIEDVKYWVIKKAPDPANIIWENLNLESSGISRKTLLINTSVFLVAMFLTTPTVVISSLNLEILFQHVSGFYLARFLPTLVVWILSLAIPAMVIYSSGFLDFETKSDLNRSVMIKTVIFLILAVVILPSFGLTSISAFITTDPGETVRWKCIFLPDNGSFFVSYVMFAAFIGNILQILKPGEIILFFFYMLMSKSEVEKRAIRKSLIWDFNYGVQYSHGIMILFLVLFYSLLVPVISPFGLLYFCFKYIVDRYNIFFNHKPTRASYSVHILTIQFMLFVQIMKNIGLFVILYIRTGWNVPTHLAQVIALFTIAICLGCMNPCRWRFLPSWLLLPHHFRHKSIYEYTFDYKEEEAKVYHPFVLTKYISVLCSLDKYGNPIPEENAVDAEEDFLQDNDFRFC